jgi:L-alanine-DL-glutamate epimerase-like enolase superfamily enzyme
MVDIERVQAVHRLIAGRVHLMVDANQQWDRHRPCVSGNAVEPLNLTWIEEPLDAYDAEGHAHAGRHALTRPSPPARC